MTSLIWTLLFQVRSQEEIMNECQVWWTITGNFGNMMPIDWSKSTTRAKQLPTLNLVKHRCILIKWFVETFNNLAAMVLHKL